ncbi:hypothetical protein D3C71_1547210 [compost metagenome]
MIQSGLASIKTVQSLEHVTYLSEKFNFDCLLSMYGVEFEEDSLKNADRILASQRNFSTVVIDCPLENLHYLKDIMLYCSVVVCMHSNLACTLNTVLGLDSVFEDKKLSSFLFNSSQFFVTDNGEVKVIEKALTYIEDIFSLDKAEVNWSKIPITASVATFPSLLETL